MADDSSTQCPIFEEDEVLFDSPTARKWGIVVQSSHYASSDDEDDFDLKKGTVRVAWHPSGKEQVLSEKKVGKYINFLMHTNLQIRKIIT